MASLSSIRSKLWREKRKDDVGFLERERSRKREARRARSAEKKEHDRRNFREISGSRDFEMASSPPTSFPDPDTMLMDLDALPVSSVLETDSVNQHDVNSSSSENGMTPPMGNSESRVENGRDNITHGHARRDYFHRIQTILSHVEDFEAMKSHCDSYSRHIEQTYPIDDLPVLDVNEYQLDNVASSLYPHNDAPKYFAPIQTVGDGNCLPRIGSLFAFGEDKHHTEIRVRIFMELCRFEDHYLDNSYLNRGTDTPTEDIAMTLASYSNAYIQHGKGKCRFVFRQYVKNILQTNTFNEMWSIFALASVLGVQICSIYPSYGGYNVRKHLHRHVMTRVLRHDNSRIVHIMWTNTHGKQQNSISWTPNHFVAVLPPHDTILARAEKVQFGSPAQNMLTEMQMGIYDNRSSIHCEASLTYHMDIPSHLRQSEKVGTPTSTILQNVLEEDSPVPLIDEAPGRRTFLERKKQVVHTANNTTISIALEDVSSGSRGVEMACNPSTSFSYPDTVLIDLDALPVSSGLETVSMNQLGANSRRSNIHCEASLINPMNTSLQPRQNEKVDSPTSIILQKVMEEDSPVPLIDDAPGRRTFLIKTGHDLTGNSYPSNAMTAYLSGKESQSSDDQKDTDERRHDERCPSHPRQELVYLCTTCNEQPLCYKCHLEGHQGHELADLKKCLPEREIMYIRKLTKKREELREEIKRRKRDHEENVQCMEREINDMNRSYKEQLATWTRIQKEQVCERDKKIKTKIQALEAKLRDSDTFAANKYLELRTLPVAQRLTAMCVESRQDSIADMYPHTKLVYRAEPAHILEQLGTLTEIPYNIENSKSGGSRQVRYGSESLRVPGGDTFEQQSEQEEPCISPHRDANTQTRTMSGDRSTQKDDDTQFKDEQGTTETSLMSTKIIQSQVDEVPHSTTDHHMITNQADEASHSTTYPHVITNQTDGPSHSTTYPNVIANQADGPSHITTYPYVMTNQTDGPPHSTTDHHMITIQADGPSHITTYPYVMTNQTDGPPHSTTDHHVIKSNGIGPSHSTTDHYVITSQADMLSHNTTDHHMITSSDIEPSHSTTDHHMIATNDIGPPHSTTDYDVITSHDFGPSNNTTDHHMITSKAKRLSHSTTNHVITNDKSRVVKVLTIPSGIYLFFSLRCLGTVLYACDQLDESVLRVTNTGATQKFRLKENRPIKCICVSPADSTVWYIHSDHTVKRVTSTGMPETMFTVSGVAKSMCVTSIGHVLVYELRKGRGILTLYTAMGDMTRSIVVNYCPSCIMECPQTHDIAILYNTTDTIDSHAITLYDSSLTHICTYTIGNYRFGYICDICFDRCGHILVCSYKKLIMLDQKTGRYIRTVCDHNTFKYVHLYACDVDDDGMLWVISEDDKVRGIRL